MAQSTHGKTLDKEIFVPFYIYPLLGFFWLEPSLFKRQGTRYASLLPQSPSFQSFHCVSMAVYKETFLKLLSSTSLPSTEKDCMRKGSLKSSKGAGGMKGIFKQETKRSAPTREGSECGENVQILKRLI